MRKSIFFALAAIALTAAACTVQNQKEEPAPAQSEGQEMVFHAVCGDEADLSSRTARQADGKVFWSPNDVIAVFQGTMYEGAI
ncbi:MAG: hypothetical protein J5764_00625, partial [Bacteroidales bacterium]|nr:hypothetical protein [Bacteroidales bacterium]